MKEIIIQLLAGVGAVTLILLVFVLMIPLMDWLSTWKSRRALIDDAVYCSIPGMRRRIERLEEARQDRMFSNVEAERKWHEIQNDRLMKLEGLVNARKK